MSPKTTPEERAGLRQRSTDRLNTYEGHRCKPQIFFGDIQPEFEKLLLDVLDDLEMFIEQQKADDWEHGRDLMPDLCGR